MAQEEDDMMAMCHGEDQEGPGKALLESGMEERRSGRVWVPLYVYPTRLWQGQMMTESSTGMHRGSSPSDLSRLAMVLGEAR